MAGAPFALMVLFVFLALTLASPVVPVLPESPDTASGSAIAVDVAGPVSPVLVADDCAITVPELPVIAEGDWVRLALPPFPPLAEVEAMESPPLILPTPTRA